MSSSIDQCSIHEPHHHSPSLFQRVWDEINSRLLETDATQKRREELLSQEKQAQLQRMTSRNADIHRMISRSIL